MTPTSIKLALQVSDCTLYGLDLTRDQFGFIVSSREFLEDFEGEAGDLWEGYLSHEGLSEEELREASKIIPVPGPEGLVFVDYRSRTILILNDVLGLYRRLSPWELRVFPLDLEGAKEFAGEVLRLLPRPFSPEEVLAWEKWAKEKFKLGEGEEFFPSEPEEW